jgi:hypothetical protein
LGGGGVGANHPALPASLLGLLGVSELG